MACEDPGCAYCPGALQLADTYFSRVWGPLKPGKLPSKLREKREG